MRSNLELWKIVRDNFDENFKTNLHHLIIKISHILKIITYHESIILIKELNSYNLGRKYHYDLFLGEECDPKPRKEFIEKMIKKHKNIL